MKKLVHVKSLITLALCLMMCFTFFAPASTVQAKKRVVDNVFIQIRLQRCHSMNY